jgi:hypothetical protein
MEYAFKPKEWHLPVKGKRPAKKVPAPPSKPLYIPKDIKFYLYTNEEVMAIVRSYVDHLGWVSEQDLSAEHINDMVMHLDRMKFLLGQIRLGKT